jgi:polysaccharide pyruvyl transferase WcaK-like protein
MYGKWQLKYPGKIGTIEGRFNVNEIKYVIGMCDFFIGSRMHACVGAISQAIPAVSIAYSDKFVGVMQTVGAESLVADPRSLNIAEIIERIGTRFDEAAEIRRGLQQKMPQVEKAIVETLARAMDARPATLELCESAHGV